MKDKKSIEYRKYDSSNQLTNGDNYLVVRRNFSSEMKLTFFSSLSNILNTRQGLENVFLELSQFKNHLDEIEYHRYFLLINQ